MDHDIIPEALDDLISDIHELLDEKKPAAEEEVPAVQEAEPVAEELPEEEPAAEEPEQDQNQRWTDRQKVPKHVAKLQQHQQEAYAQWLREQEERGDTVPPELERGTEGEELPDFLQPPKKKRTGLWVALSLVLVTALAMLLTFWLLPKQPRSPQEGLRSRGSVTVVVAGADQSMARTDMIMLMSMDRRDSKLSLVSIPRDTAVAEGVTLETVYGRAGGGAEGVEALKQAVAAMTGIVPDGCLVLHEQTVTEFVDAAGGIRFDVPAAVKLGEVEVEAGTQVLSGKQAYAVLRLGGKGQADLERSETQRQFMAAAIRRCCRLSGVMKAPRLLDAITGTCATDLNTRQILWLARTALALDLDSVYTDVLPGSFFGEHYVTNETLVLQTVNAYCSPFLRTITAEDMQISEGS